MLILFAAGCGGGGTVLEPAGGGSTFLLGEGDLLVTGGTAPRTREHAVPKVAHAGPRISLAYRHGLDPRAYAHKRTEFYR